MIAFMAEAIAAVHVEQETVRLARANLSPEDFAAWQSARAAERRHRETCRAIEQAGRNARPRGLGVFW